MLWLVAFLIIFLKLNKIGREIMATKDDVLQAIADEKAQVSQAVSNLNTLVQSLKDQLAAGTNVTAADLDQIVAAVHDIFVPPAPPAPPAV